METRVVTGFIQRIELMSASSLTWPMDASCNRRKTGLCGHQVRLSVRWIKWGSSGSRRFVRRTKFNPRTTVVHWLCLAKACHMETSRGQWLISWIYQATVRWNLDTVDGDFDRKEEYWHGQILGHSTRWVKRGLSGSSLYPSDKGAWSSLFYYRGSKTFV